MNDKARLLSITSFTIYSILNGIIYQWSFWGNFEINIMQFISINDLLPSIAFSVALPITFLVLYTFLMSLIVESKLFNKTIDFISDQDLNSKASDIILTSEIKKNKTSFFRSNFLYVVLFIVCVIALTFLVLLYYKNPDIGLKNIIMIGVCYSLGTILYKSENIRRSLGKHFMPIIVIISLIPFIMVASGAVNARKIQKGEDTFIVKSEEACSKNKNEKYRYIANISDKAFAYSLTDNSICIFKYNSLLLTKEKKPKNAEPIPPTSNRP